MYQSPVWGPPEHVTWERSSCNSDLAPPPHLKPRRKREKITSSPAVARRGICRSDPAPRWVDLACVVLECP